MAHTGETPLTAAARYHWYETVAVLVSTMPGPNGRTNLFYADGFTALHHALADYANERIESSGHLKRVTTQTVLALLASPKVDVGAKTAIGATAWQMAIGLPDVQRAIERHPTFTAASREEVRERLRAFPLKERQDKLIDAVKSRNVDLYDAVLDDFAPGEVLDGSRVVSGAALSLGEFMIEAGWIDRLSDLIVSGRLDPWRDAEGYDGLLVQSHMAGATSLFKLVRERMPAAISATIANTVLYHPAQPDNVPLDPDRTITQAMLERMPRSELDPTMFAAAKCGDRRLFEQAERAGGNPAALDDWGRTLTQVSPGPDGMVAGEDLFWPGASGWSVVNDVELRNLLKGSRQIAKLIWDELIDVKWREVPYYPGANLIVITHPNWRPANRAIYWLRNSEKLYHLDGTSPPIHQFNADHGATITTETALDYLRFFLFFVRGEDGPFYVVASNDAPYLPDIMLEDTAAPELRQRFASVFRPPRAYGTSVDGHQRISVICYYGNALFAIDAYIHSTGMVEMVDDTPILQGLPATINAPI